MNGNIEKGQLRATKMQNKQLGISTQRLFFDLLRSNKWVTHYSYSYSGIYCCYIFYSLGRFQYFELAVSL